MSGDTFDENEARKNEEEEDESSFIDADDNNFDELMAQLDVIEGKTSKPSKKTNTTFPKPAGTPGRKVPGGDIPDVGKDAKEIAELVRKDKEKIPKKGVR